MDRGASFATVVIAATAAILLLMFSAGRPPSGGASSGSGPAGAVQVVDYGFSMEPGFHVSYAFVIENAMADQVLEGGSYSVRFFDRDGRLVAARRGLLPLLFPGPMAIGEDYVPVAREAASMLVTIDGGATAPASGLKGFRPERLTSFSGPATGPPGASGGSSATSAVLNPFDFALAEVFVGVVFRDPQGRIAGGSSASLRDVGPGSLTPVLSHVELGASPSLAPTATMFYAAPAGVTVAELQQAAAAARAVPTPGPSVVKWEPATLPAPPPELAAPFAGRAAEPSWQVFAVDGRAAPRSLLQTSRAVIAEWPPASDRPALRFFSAGGEGAPPEPLGGFMLPDLAGREPPLEVIAGSGYQLWPSPDGRSVLVEAQGLGRGEIYLVERSGATRRLTGIRGMLSYVAWSPDSRWLAVSALEQAQPGSGVSTLYLAPVGDGEAVTVARGLQDFVVGAWAPDSRTFAYVHRGRMYVFDRQTGLREVGAADYDMHWSRDGALIVSGASVWDVASGRLLFAPAADTRVTGGEVSPDGNWLVYTEDASYTQPESRRCPGTALANRTHVAGLATGVDRVLLDCDQGFHYLVTWSGTQWLGAGKVVLPVPSCWGCEGETVRIDLLDVGSGVLTTVADKARDGRVTFSVSPAGDCLAVGGRSLRLYGVHGALLAEYPAPAGKVIASIAFSPDGATIVYVAAPEDFAFGI
jgi:Tol biopolymer transport system component